MSPIITASSQSRTADRRQPIKIALDLNNPRSDGDVDSKTPISWEPPLAWASSIEQDPESLPRLDALQTQSMLDDAAEVSLNRMQCEFAAASLITFDDSIESKKINGKHLSGFACRQRTLVTHL